MDNLPVVRNLILHWESRLLVWPSKGIIYGRMGEPVGAVCADGYVRLGGRPAGTLYAHRIVWEAVNGPIPVGLEIDHRNGRKNDNRIRNLDLVTRAENVRRAYAMGLAATGEACRHSKLTEDIVCQLRVSNLPTRTWAAMLQVDPATVRMARRGRTWKQVACRGRRPIKSKRGARRG